MNPILRILAKTDGSITKIIEALTGEKAEIRTIEQRIIKADESIAKTLKIKEGDEVNYRVVEIISGGKVFVKAISYTPLKRLEKRFKEDLMRADIPIGEIIRKHRMEVRREIRWATVKNYEGKKSLIRNYDIIYRNEILINITEIFPFDVYDRFCGESHEG
uniref:DUF98 domain-containing protein n=1 Tax=Geoglobus ahangari TaxID=113653 RepID=A0A7C3UIM1_9EURY